MSQLPIWMQYLTALSTPIIAIMVGIVAFLQWRTAHQNVVLALFEKRITMIDELRRIVAEVLQDGHVSNGESARFIRATKGVEFLFRGEVKAYLDRIYQILVDLHYYDAELESARDADRHDFVAKRRALRNELAAFFSSFTALVAPYVRMHQKQFWL